MNFLKIAALSPVLTLGHPKRNAAAALALLRDAHEGGAALALLPELNLTGVSCGDYFLRRDLLEQAREAMATVLEGSRELPGLLFNLGLPWEDRGHLLMLQLLIQEGRILRAQPRLTFAADPRLPESRDLPRLFHSGRELLGSVDPRLGVPYSGSETFVVETESGPVTLRLLPGTDLWTQAPDATAGLILHPYARIHQPASGEDYTRDLLSLSRGSRSEILAAGSGKGESSTDFYYRASLDHLSPDATGIPHPARREGLANAELSEILYSAILPAQLRGRALHMPHSPAGPASAPLPLALANPPLRMTSDPGERVFSPHPLFPAGAALEPYLRSVLDTQQAGLHRRLRTLSGQRVILGFSGGLDSALVLLSAREYYLRTGRDLRDLLAYTLPGPGSSAEGLELALDLMEQLGLEPRQIPISASVEQHLKDIGHPGLAQHDLTYENAQARERTQILMDLSNQLGGLVLGTGDLSEKALGWSTYNGDQMSMYEMNHSIPKTLIPYLLRLLMRDLSPAAQAHVAAILDRPISPELVPATKDQPLQSTEANLGPYALHDFFIGHIEAWGASRSELQGLAEYTFSESNLAAFSEVTGEEPHTHVAQSLRPFDSETIHHTLDEHLRRFSRSQFKRSASADGAQTGPVSYSPRQGASLPSDFFGDF